MALAHGFCLGLTGDPLSRCPYFTESKTHTEQINPVLSFPKKNITLANSDFGAVSDFMFVYPIATITSFSFCSSSVKYLQRTVAYGEYCNIWKRQQSVLESSQMA